jgi:hypothetical protein
MFPLWRFFADPPAGGVVEPGLRGDPAAGAGGNGGGGGGGGAGGGTEEQTIPRARFDEVYRKGKDAEAKLAELSERERQYMQERGELLARLEAAEGGKKDPPKEDDGLPPELRDYAKKLEGDITRKVQYQNTIAWLESQPERREDPDFSVNFKYMLDKVAGEYGLDVKTNPAGTIRLAFHLYKQVWEQVKAEKAKEDKEKGKENGSGKGDRVGADALRPLTGGGGQKGGKKFSRSQIASMSVEEYKKNRGAIREAANAGEISDD